MLELQEELFSLHTRFDAICVTTNYVVGKDNKAIMGGGCALECARKWPQTPYILGERLSESGRNIPFQLGLIAPDGHLVTNAFVEEDLSDVGTLFADPAVYYCRLFSFPTKQHYKDASDINLIKESCQHMMNYADALELKHIAVPRPGSGLGMLDYLSEVKPIISKILDDRFYIVHLEGK